MLKTTNDDPGVNNCGIGERPDRADAEVATIGKRGVARRRQQSVSGEVIGLLLGGVATTSNLLDLDERISSVKKEVPQFVEEREPEDITPLSPDAQDGSTALRRGSIQKVAPWA